ncbi:MAG TPA: NADH-quinone oxidoreductase subunit C, partial [Pirellulaceae bacterium]
MSFATNRLDALQARFEGLQGDEFRGQSRIAVPRGVLYDVLLALKQDDEFDLLIDITCVDYLRYRGARDRF